MDIDTFGFARGSPRRAVVLVLPDELLLLAVHTDHRITDSRVPTDGVMDMAELGVAIDVLFALHRLGVALQAVAGLVQQSPDQRRGHLEALRTQLAGQRAQRLRRPPQRRHRITARLGLHQRIQRLDKTGLEILGRLAAPACHPRTTHRQRLGVIKLIATPAHSVR
jgi:hypothetical protein